MSDNIITIENLRRVALKPGDVLVITTEQKLSDRIAELLLASCEFVFPNNKVLILDSGMQVAVVGRAGDES